MMGSLTFLYNTISLRVMQLEAHREQMRITQEMFRVTSEIGRLQSLCNSQLLAKKNEVRAAAQVEISRIDMGNINNLLDQLNAEGTSDAQKTTLTAQLQQAQAAVQTDKQTIQQYMEMEISQLEQQAEDYRMMIITPMQEYEKQLATDLETAKAKSEELKMQYEASKEGFKSDLQNWKMEVGGN